MANYTRGDTFSHWREFRNRAGTKIDPTSVKMTISDTCGNAVLTAQDMVKDSLGVYYYDYQIDAAAVFGEYSVEIDAVYNSKTIKFDDTFYILPWQAVDQVRSLSGIEETKSISDDDLARVIWEAYTEALESIFEFHEYETPNYYRDVGTKNGCIDGSNTTFWLKYNNLADQNGDGVVDGYGEKSCGTDVFAWWKDSNTNVLKCKVTVDDAFSGKLTISQLDGSAIPTTASDIFVDYYIQTPVFSDKLFRKAVAYLAAHEVILRFHELDRATMADLNSNRQIILANPNRMENKYKTIMKKIKVPRVGGV